MKRLTLVMVLVMTACFVVRAEKLLVCNDCQYTTLESALIAAAPHDTILLKKGTYACPQLEVKKPLTLMGETGAILDGKAIGYVLKILSDSVTIENLQFKNTGKSYTKDYAAVYLYQVAHFALINNTVENAFFGILIEKSKDGVVKGNNITGHSTREDDSGNGIHLWHCQRVDVKENEVIGMRDGIYFEFVDESWVRNNYTHQNVRYGLHFMFSNHDSYEYNTFENNGAGVAVMFSKWIIMRNNRFVENWGTASYGLLLKEIYDGDVSNNLFEENTLGIYIDGSTRMNYTGNTFRQNGWAVKVSGGCYANVFEHNNFISNSFDISYNSKMNDNTFDGNFWSEYTGYDLDRDGLGDIPYRPVKLFSYIVNKTPETIVLLRSLFVDIINFSEKVSPVFTPDDLIDASPSMKAFK